MSDDEHGPKPSLKPTAPSTLAVVGLAGAALTLLLVARYYQQAPRLDWYNSLAIFAVAALLAWMGWTTRKALHPSRRQLRAASIGGERPAGAPGRLEGPGHALQIARFAVLAKAAAIAGAAFFGAYLGFTVWLSVQSSRLTAAGEDLPPAVLGTVACALLTASALWLEHSCRIPPQDDDEDDDEPTRP
jgi:type VI protein secretion system component VasF